MSTLAVGWANENFVRMIHSCHFQSTEPILKIQRLTSVVYTPTDAPYNSYEPLEVRDAQPRGNAHLEALTLMTTQPISRIV
jgi:hypothetical protein